MSSDRVAVGFQTGLELLQEQIRLCRACELGGHLVEARPIRHGGLASANVMLIGQAPGARSDAARQHFVGPAGQLLAGYFEQAGFPSGYFRERVYLTSMTRCFPGKSRDGKGDRVPSRAELALCRGFLDRELTLVRPRLVLLVGQLAIQSFLGSCRLVDVVGTLVERDDRAYLPLPHTSPVSRWLNEPAHRARLEAAIALLGKCREQLALV